ncbi:uncharacterized protein BX663DRAFT_549664 [Cokeromyces recurvatus]|uniref:uncharacterized protein n=1 Tax=Cokeromyces recurvatus TaxID=90255 RepID=UPI002220A876|nr:uncharacterized protein BX663DRAFT_549664 [Cokeromyces recurvatus]KAI7905696.1 hypothetical protein BX663DRAFT_549664 [Cokeromyces recurvatus]
MQIPVKPDSLIKLPLEIEQLNKTQTHLFQGQEEYKHKARLLTGTQDDTSLHPKAFEEELKDLQDHFQSLQKHYNEVFTQQMFLERLLEPSPFPVMNLNESEQKAEALKEELNSYTFQIEDLKNQIKFLSQSLEAARKDSTHVIDEATNMLDQITAMEEEIKRIDSLISRQSKYTIEEAKIILKGQTEEITKLNRAIVEKQDNIEEQQWTVEDLEEEVNQLNEKAEELTKTSNKVLSMNQQKNKQIEEDYFRYIDYVNMCNQMYGVERIDFESSTKIRITYAKPIEAVLHIELNDTGNRIENVKVWV